MVFEASGVDEAADGVAGEVSESQGDAAQVFQAAVDCFGGAVGGTGVVEVGQDILAAADQGPGQCLDLLQAVGDGLLQGADEPLHQEPPQARLLGAVGLDPGAGRHPRRPEPQHGAHRRTEPQDARSGRR